jgi:hypothetical protein
LQKGIYIYTHILTKGSHGKICIRLFFCGRGLRPCIYYVLSLRTELSSQEQNMYPALQEHKQFIGLFHNKFNPLVLKQSRKKSRTIIILTTMECVTTIIGFDIETSHFRDYM